MDDATFKAFIAALDSFFLLLGWVFSIFGVFGFILVIVFYPRGIFNDNILNYMSGFIYSFMGIMGIMLLKFHDKIIVRPR